MKIQNHISDILQLYEFSMAIGKSLDYKETCDSFLKLIMKRKNLNAAWIIEARDRQLISTYALPLGQHVDSAPSSELTELLGSIEAFKYLNNNPIISEIAPIDTTNGYHAVFNLKEQGYLFVYSKNDTINIKNLLQLQPVIHKFSVALQACKAFSEQQKLLNNLEIRNQELSDYAHMVSHDLKSPLRSIDTLTAWLKEDYSDKLDFEGQKQLTHIRHSVEKMDTLINGILEYSTIAKNQIDVYQVDLNRLIKEIINSIEIPKHITITKTNLPTVIGDKYRLQQLFQNLIDNAILYNDKANGEIEIGCEEEQDGFWEFYVKDNGMGIEDVYFDKIFKTFEKLGNNTKSTGIGLSIVKKIIDLYGGSIWLTSKLHEGTTFNFTLKK